MSGYKSTGAFNLDTRLVDSPMVLLSLPMNLLLLLLAHLISRQRLQFLPLLSVLSTKPFTKLQFLSLEELFLLYLVFPLMALLFYLDLLLALFDLLYLLILLL